MISGILLILCLLFFPGFFTVKILFRKKDGLGPVETLFLSTAFSLCVILFICIALNFTSGLKTSLPLLIIAAYTFFAALICLIRNKPSFIFKSPEDKNALFVFSAALVFLFLTTYHRDFHFLPSLRKYVFIGDTQFFAYNALKIMQAGRYVPWQNTVNYAPGLFFVIIVSHFLTGLHLIYLCNVWAVFSPLLIFTGIYVLSYRLIKNSFFSSLAAFLYVSQIANYKYYMGPILDPFMFSLIIFLFLLNKPLLSGFAVSTVLYLHQYPVNAVPVILLYVVFLLFIQKNTAKQQAVTLGKFLLAPVLLILIFSQISPFLLSPQPRGQAKDLLTGIPTQIFLSEVTASGKPWFERIVRISLTAGGLAGCAVLLFKKLKTTERTNGKIAQERREDAVREPQSHESILYASGFFVMIAFAVAQPLFYKLGMDYHVFPFNAFMKSLYDIHMNDVSDFGILRMFKRFFLWMEPARPLHFFYIFASVLTAYFLNDAAFKKNKKHTPPFYAAAAACLLALFAETHLLSLKNQLPADGVFYSDWDKTYVSSSDMDAMLWIYHNTPFSTRVGITNINGKPDPQITLPSQRQAVTNQNRLVTAFTMRSVNKNPLPVTISKYKAMNIINLSLQDVFLLQSIEERLIPTITVVENGKRNSLASWGINNRARTKIFLSGEYLSILLFSKPPQPRKAS